MKSRIRWINMMGGFIFACGLLTNINSIMRHEGIMIREAILYSQNMRIPDESDLKIANFWLTTASLFMASVGAALVFWGKRDD
jgi:hypothetical protein